MRPLRQDTEVPVTTTDKADLFAFAWKLLAPPGVPQPEREAQFALPRRWRFDFSWPIERISVEIDGGQWQAHGGRHNTDADRDKLNAAAVLGWRVLRFSTQQLERDPQACVDLVLRALGVKE